jgi:type 2 lantibiotic biosynthesis protein LanM
MSHPFLKPASSVARDLTRQWQEAVAAAALQLPGPTVSTWALLDTAENYTWVTDARRRMPSRSEDDAQACVVPIDDPRDIPDPISDSAAWLRWLATRASSLFDRLGIPQCMVEADSDERLVEARLRAWMGCVASQGDDGSFEKYLRWNDTGDTAVRHALAPARYREDVPLPVWCKTLGEAVFDRSVVVLTGVCDPGRPLPFETLLLPFVHLSLRRICEAAHAAFSQLGPGAQADLARSLLEALVHAAKDAFYLEFACYRASDLAPLAPFIYREPDALYSQFIAHMQAGGLIAFYEKYPALARLFAVLTDLGVETAIEFLRRLEADLPRIGQLWGIEQPGPVVRLRDKISDPHRGGRQTIEVTFACGLHLVYKPRNMGMEAAYNGLVTWLNEHDSPVTLRPLRVLNFGTHGWVEFATHDACTDQSAVERYYRRAGALVCLVYSLRGSDCHLENIVAAGEFPVLVDCETLVEPWPWVLDAGGHRDRRQVTVSRLLRDSVLMGGLLPNPTDSVAMEGLGEIWGLGGGDSTAPVSQQHWINVNSDYMAIVSRQEQPSSWCNIPHVDGSRAHVGANLEPLVAGFQTMYRFLVTQQPILSGEDGPLTAFRGQFVRFIFRATRIYTRLYGDVLQPAALRDGVAQSLKAEQLARAFLCVDQRPASWPLLACERRSLLQGDVPYFGGYTDDTSLLLEDGSSIEGYFAEPSYQAVLRKLSQLSEADLAFQVQLMRSALSQQWAAKAS